MALMLLAVMVLVVVGLLGSSISSKVSANNDQQIERARGAVRSGLASVQSTLEHATWNDDYVVLNRELNPSATADRDRQPVLMIARAELGADATLNTPCVSTVWNFTPLVSGIETVAAPAAGPLVSPNSLGHVVKSDPVTGATLNEATGLPRTLPWQPPVTTHWEVVYDPESQEPVARYCFWVEDMQAYLDLNKAGNYGDNLADSTGMMERQHERETPVIFDSVSQVEAPRDWYAGIAPGLRTPDDNPATDDRHWSFSQASLFSLVSPSLPDDTPAQRVDNALMLARWMPLRGQTTQYASLLAGPEDWKAALIHLQPQNNWRAWLTRNPYDASKSEPDAGRLIDTVARLIEENSIIGIQPYLEYNLVPADYGVFARPREPKLNLNRVLEQLARKQITREAAVNLIADHIERHLPSPAAANSTSSTPLTAPTMTASATERFGFAQRSGAYPFPRRASTTSQTAASCRAYLQNLAASILDYADQDCVPTIKEDRQPGVDVAWRGMDSTPVVSEHYVRYRLDEINGSTIKVSVTFYTELWNMSNLPVTGTYQHEHVCRTGFTAGIGTGGSNYYSLDLSVNKARNALTPDSKNEIKTEAATSGTSYWLPLYETDGLGGVKTPAASITLKPNEYRVLATKEIKFEYKISLPNGTSISQLTVEQDLTSYYRIRFDPAPLIQTPALLGVAASDAANMDTSVVLDVSSDAQSKSYAIIDRCNAIYRRAAGLSTSTAASAQRQGMRGTPPGNATETPSAPFVNTNGDPRSAFYMLDPLNSNAYDSNSSLWGPTIRRGINSKNLYYATYPSRWADRGHDLNVQQGVNAGDQKKEPFHKDIVGSLPEVEPWHSTLAPMRISNAGRFFSVTELGHIFDPIFWDPNGGGPTNNPLLDTTANLSPWKFYWDLGTQVNGETEETGVAPFSLITGGNTLRIGRPEHRLLRTQLTGGKRLTRGLSATALLDLFHSGVSAVGATQAISDSQGVAIVSSEQAAKNLRDLTGPLSEVNGHVNINTASRHVLRSLVTGTLVADAGRKDNSMTAWPAVRPPQNPVSSSASSQADRLVDAIVRGRPYVSPAAVADKAVDVTTVGGQVQSTPAFGVDKNHAGWVDGQSEWNDAAAEEVFARLYNSSTVRSRNFRIFVTGQAIRARRSDPNQFDVLATRSKVYHVHIHPVRDPVTGIITRQRAEVTYEQDL